MQHKCNPYQTQTLFSKLWQRQKRISWNTHTHTRSSPPPPQAHKTRPPPPPPHWLKKITATWSGTTSITQRPPKAPQVSFNMSKGPLLPPGSPCGHSSGCSGGHQNKTHPRGESSQLTMHINYSAVRTQLGAPKLWQDNLTIKMLRSHYGL